MLKVFEILKRGVVGNEDYSLLGYCCAEVIVVLLVKRIVVY